MLESFPPLATKPAEPENYDDLVKAVSVYSPRLGDAVRRLASKVTSSERQRWLQNSGHSPNTQIPQEAHSSGFGAFFSAELLKPLSHPYALTLAGWFVWKAQFFTRSSVGLLRFLVTKDRIWLFLALLNP